MFKKLMIVCLVLTMLVTFANAFEARRDLYVKWDGKLTDNDFTEQQFASWTKTTVYASEKSPTGYYVTFRYYGPNETRVRIAGEWYYSEEIYSSQFTAAMTHPNDWYNGCIIHTDDSFPLRPFNDMELNTATGYWSYTIPLASGTYCYQFLVGGTASDRIDDTNSGRLMSDPQNLPAERQLGVEAYSQVLVPYHPVKQSLSPNYSFYQFEEPKGKAGKILYDIVPSESLGCHNPIGIYLPYDYNKNRARPYPLLIIGHGIAGFESNWMSQGMLGNITDNLIAEGLVEPMIVVTPNMRDANGAYLNSNVNAAGTPTGNAQKYIMDELIPYMERYYNVSKDPAQRALSGLSAGGMLTFNMFLSNPTDFGYFYIMSAGSSSPGNYDLTREELKKPTLVISTGIFDRLFYSQVNPTQGAFANAGISFTNYYAIGAHRWHVWRELYVDLCKRVLWKDLQPEPPRPPRPWDPDYDGCNLGVPFLAALFFGMFLFFKKSRHNKK